MQIEDGKTADMQKSLSPVIFHRDKKKLEYNGSTKSLVLSHCKIIDSFARSGTNTLSPERLEEVLQETGKGKVRGETTIVNLSFSLLDTFSVSFIGYPSPDPTAMPRDYIFRAKIIPIPPYEGEHVSIPAIANASIEQVVAPVNKTVELPQEEKSPTPVIEEVIAVEDIPALHPDELQEITAATVSLDLDAEEQSRSIYEQYKLQMAEERRKERDAEREPYVLHAIQRVQKAFQQKNGNGRTSIVDFLNLKDARLRARAVQAGAILVPRPFPTPAKSEEKPMRKRRRRIDDTPKLSEVDLVSLVYYQRIDALDGIDCRREMKEARKKIEDTITFMKQQAAE